MTAADRTSAGRWLALRPRLKNVAATPYCCRIESSALVVVPGPSSKVRATVFPEPGAVERTLAVVAGQPVETTSGVAGTPVGSPARTCRGGHGPSADGAGPGSARAGDAAASASVTGPRRRSAH